MSTQINKALAVLHAANDYGPWGQLLTHPVRRAHRSASLRLQSASRSLASLRLSERNEKEMLHLATQALRRAEADRATQGKELAILTLAVDTHRANVATIERQIALVRLAIEHLNRRANRLPASRIEPSRQQKDEEPSETMLRGFEAVREIRRLSFAVGSRRG